jgi:hypothetical protein
MRRSLRPGKPSAVSEAIGSEPIVSESNFFKPILSQPAFFGPVFSESIRAQLNMYALAASAAGVGLLALTAPAQAEVVYTPVNQVIGYNGVYGLDLNHDGTVDFLIQQWNYGNWASNNQLLADPAVGNGVEGIRRAAAVLQSGQPIGPSQNFIAGDQNGEVMLSVTHTTTGGPSHLHGSWANLSNRYLGLKFQISGQTHYGWARVNVQRKGFHFLATLTGYAYETTPNTAINAGQTSDVADGFTGQSLSDSAAHSSAPEALANSGNSLAPRRYQSLGELALGAQSVPVRRQP